MFALSPEPLDTAALQHELEVSSAGAVVMFEGRVRNRNEGRDVEALTYEAAPPLVQQAWQPIEQEALELFSILSIHGMHRTGRLVVGDTAVWIGVAAEHRSAAFDACRFVIDELKKRVPVWKKEHYTDGSSRWINSP